MRHARPIVRYRVASRAWPSWLRWMVGPGLALGLMITTGASANAVIQPSPPISVSARADEFVGPFASWSNVQRDYGAVADGVADDTAALQAALGQLGAPGRAPVLFIPAGTYRITRTLDVSNVMSVSVVGEDPARTHLVWDGPEAGTMLSVNGVAYSRFIRLTFDGRTRADVAVDQSWDGLRPYFDTGNEYADDRFVDTAYGIRGGFKGQGFAETSILRSQFIRNTGAGVSLGNFNALDIWVWYSTFEDCGVGVTNGGGAGNYHVYNSLFRRSTSSDLFMGNTGGFSARGNHSSGSRAFFTSDGNTNNPATVILQGNTILDTAEPVAIRLGNQGPGLIVDNVIRSRGTDGPVIEWKSALGADLVAVGNTFTASDPITSNGRLLALDTTVVPRDTLNPSEPEMPPVLRNLRRRIFEIPRDADTRTIQSVIDVAAAEGSGRPVVHFPAGTYGIAKTLAVPHSDLQLVGDGHGTILKWTGKGAGPVVRIAGPTRVIAREIGIDGAGTADGIIVEGIDQPGSRVYMQQMELRHGATADLDVDRLDYAHVQLENVSHAYSPRGVAVRLRGGPLSAAGQKTTGRLSVFSGASGGNRVSYDVSGGGRLLLRDFWYEQGAGPGFVRVRGRAEVTIDGARVSSPVNQGAPAFDIADLDGRVSILAADIDDRVGVSGDGTRANVLGLAMICGQRVGVCFASDASPAATVALVHARQRIPLVGTRGVELSPDGLIDPAFVRTMLAQARGETATVPARLPDSVTDLRFYRVWVDNGLTNVRLAGSGSRSR